MHALRSDQTAALHAVEDCHARGTRRVLLVIPTGGGKTVTAAEWVRHGVSRGRRALWLTHRVELLAQSKAALEARGINCSHEGANECTVASLDTLVTRGHFPPADDIVFDEAHHAAAETWGALLARYTAANVLGLTATPERGDGKGLREHFDGIVSGPSVKDLTDAGVLVPLRVLRPSAPTRTGVVVQDPIEAYQDHAGNERAIAFFQSTELARKYALAFNDAGIGAACITGDTPADARAFYVDAFRKGALRVLTNVNVLTEGFDCPAASVAIIARGCGTTGTFDQIVGRVVRSYQGKDGALLLDLRGQSHLHGLPIKGRLYSLDGVGISKPGATLESYCTVCGAIRIPGEPCLDCGSSPATATLRVKKEALKAYDYITPMRAYTTEQRYASLRKWLALARAKGHKLGAVHGKYRAVFGTTIPRDLWDRAMRGDKR